MNKKTDLSLPAVGGSSLLTIFAVLCLSVLALLSLATVRADRHLAESAAQAAAAWYQADAQAQAVFARLRGGETVPDVSREAEIYRYTLPISRSQQLEAAVKKDGADWTVLRWQAVAEEPPAEETLDLWKKGDTP